MGGGEIEGNQIIDMNTKSEFLKSRFKFTDITLPPLVNQRCVTLKPISGAWVKL